MLEAEREAAKIVQKAKQCKHTMTLSKGGGGGIMDVQVNLQVYVCVYLDRIQRLKDARSEATKDIEELKAQKNQEYQNFVAEVKLLVVTWIRVMKED